MSIRLMVLNDESTCTGIEGCAVVEFDTEDDADAFADYGTDQFDLISTGLTAEVPVVKAVYKAKAKV